MRCHPPARERRRNLAAKRAARLALAFALGAVALSIVPRRRADQDVFADLRTARQISGSAQHAQDHRREPPDVRAGVVAAIMAGFFIFVVAVGAGLFAFYRWRAADAAFVDVQSFPAPRLQTRADGTPEAGIAQQKADIERFRWLDPNHVAFQIPIEDAMRIVAGRGADAYAPVSRRAVAPPDGGIKP